VGVTNTLIGSAVMFAFYNLFHMSYWFSTVSNYIVGSIVSYILNKYWTFNNREKSYKIVIRFVLNIMVCYVLAYAITKPLVRWSLSNFGGNIQDNVAMFSGMILFTVLNYFGQRFFAFKEATSVGKAKNIAR
jgi:putative flippase GtrA